MALEEDLVAHKADFSNLSSAEDRLRKLVDLSQKGAEIMHLEAAITDKGSTAQTMHMIIRLDEVYFSIYFRIHNKKGMDKILKGICKKGFEYIIKSTDDIRVDIMEVHHPDAVMQAYKRGLDTVCKANGWC